MLTFRLAFGQIFSLVLTDIDSIHHYYFHRRYSKLHWCEDYKLQGKETARDKGRDPLVSRLPQVESNQRIYVYVRRRTGGEVPAALIEMEGDVIMPIADG